MAANYREGAYVSPFTLARRSSSQSGFDAEGNFHYPIGSGSAPLGSETSLSGKIDWDDLADVQRHVRDLKSIRRITTNQLNYFRDNNRYDTALSGSNTWYASEYGGSAKNPYYAQGLGPKDYTGKFQSDRALVRSQFWEATERKFLLREEELKGIASAPAAGGFGAGTQEAYDAQQTAREGLSRPFAEGARAAELLRQTSGPARRGGGGGGGGGAAPQGRQASRAGAAERRRMASSDRTSGGSGGGGLARRRLRASSLTGTPLGAGSQSAAQLLG